MSDATLKDIKDLNVKSLEILPETDGQKKSTADKLSDYIKEHRESNQNS